MTLKELRITKGLSQKECAAYLEMSVRNYQNYETNEEKVNTAKYHAIYNKLEVYGRLMESRSNYGTAPVCRTSVVTGAGLKAMTRSVSKFEKRDCYQALRQFVKKESGGKIGILYGLRRTGKTTLLLQMLRELPAEKTAYIKIKTTDNMSLLTRDLQELYDSGCRYVFIDEITLMEDFINTSSILSDIFAVMGMKIVVSGTDSLGFAMANRDELYDRSVMIHTSFIPFREYARLLKLDSIDSYIEYGGTLKMENMSFEDPDSTHDEVSFRDDESTRKYIDTSISRNIQHTLKHDRFGEYFNQLRDLYEQGELTNVINRIVESMNHRFLLRVVQEEFKSHDLGSAKQLLLRDFPAERAHILYDIDQKEVVERLKTIIDVRERRETTVELTEAHMEKVKKYLFMLDLITECSERYETKGAASHIVFSQPGMRYAIAKALVYSLMQDAYFASRSEADKGYITEKILEDVKGRMLEDIVLLETERALPKDREAFRFLFDGGGEYDMVVYDRQKNTCCIYEIKHSDCIDERQTRHLRDSEKNAAVTQRFGAIEGKYVLYRGVNQEVEGIRYVNVEEYLKSL